MYVDRTVCSALGILALTFAGLPAQAAMIPSSRDTELAASGQCVGNDPTCTPGLGGILMGRQSDRYTAFGPYSNSVAYFNEGSATQQSSLSNTTISVQTAANAGVFFGAASSSFSLTFSLDTSETFTLTDVIRNAGVSHTSLVQLAGPSGVVFSDSSGLGSPASGVLDAGLYSLLVQSSASADVTGAFGQANADLTVTPVPLPGGLALVVSGLMLVLLSQRRNRNAGLLAGC